MTVQGPDGGPRNRTLEAAAPRGGGRGNRKPAATRGNNGNRAGPGSGANRRNNGNNRGNNRGSGGQRNNQGGAFQTKQSNSNRRVQQVEQEPRSFGTNNNVVGNNVGRRFEDKSSGQCPGSELQVTFLFLFKIGKYGIFT